MTATGVGWLGAPEWPDRRLWVWQLGFGTVSALATFLAPLAVRGREHIPAEGPYILAANHIDWKDPPWIEFAFRVPLRYMAKQEVFEVPLIGGVLRGIGCFPVRRGEADRRAIVTALRVLETGHPLGFFPEGHRSEDGVLRRGHPGIALLAERSGAPIVPVGIAGTTHARLGRFWRRDIDVVIGESFRVADLASSERSSADATTAAIMRRIARLLPEEMRGEHR
ncbi:MAG: 1-acyl-sn-glycerol-3-phosphate acyltransferase [Chloroflexi bacterium]|nr:1-acyl-sn-glycerol-3-phosphate acyltransferase [Chloroflexota bacterium]